MSKSKSIPPNLKDRVLAEVRRDPKKASILGALALVLLIIGVREVARRSGSPAPVRASGEMSLRKTASGARAPGLAKGQGRQGDLSLPIAKAMVDRDIFTPNVAYFPVEDKSKPASVVSSAKVVDPTAKAEAARLQVQAQAKALSLQSTVWGSGIPTAIINGRVLRVGDWVSDFQIVQINPRSCQLEKSGIRVMLEMAD